MHKKLKSCKVFLCAMLCSLLTGLALTVSADDTDIYTGAALGGGVAPLVMFSIDYRSNLGSSICSGSECDNLITQGYLPATGPYSRFDVLRAVLKKVLSAVGDLEIGLMMNHDDNCNPSTNTTGCSNGGYIIKGFTPIADVTPVNPADPGYAAYLNNVPNKAAFATALDAIPNPGGTFNHPYQGRELFFEFFRYLTGQDVFKAHVGYKDFGNTDAATNLDTDLAAIKRDMSIESDADGNYDTAGTYTSPLDTNCSKVFSVNFMFQATNQEADADTAIAETKANGGMNGLNVSGSNKKLPTVLNWLHNTDLADNTYGTAGDIEGVQNVTSYFIMEPTHINTTTNGYANAGGTTAAISWDDDPDLLVEKLTNLLNEIISVSTTFTASSVPVSVLNRAQMVNNIYIALFKADQNGRKRWPGNVKKLMFDDTSSFLVDATAVADGGPQPAIATDGRIKNTALTYWTNGAALPTADPDNDEVTGKDGRAIERGGAGQKIPGFISGSPGTLNTTPGARQLFYEPTSGTALPEFNADATTVTALQTLLGAADATEAETLLKYARGIDVNDDDGDGSTTDTRPWILGDSLHSRPLPINYGKRTGHTNVVDIRIVMGSNDGFFHMFTNIDTDAENNAELGEEAWAYMPQAVMPIIKQLKENSGGDHPYGVDGAPAVYLDYGTIEPEIIDNSGADSTDKAWVYFGLRRGGRGYYGLDVTNPDAPTKLWSITNATTNFSRLGYTFATPQVGEMTWDTGSTIVTKPVVIFSGGYDLNKDSNRTDDSYGNAIYIVDAETGTLVWQTEYGATTGNDSTTRYFHSDMVNSIPSTITTVDSDGDGLVDRMYVGDTGGRIWRIDVNGTNRSDWKATVLASVGRHYNNSPANDRRFFHRPDFIQYQEANGSPYDAVVIASGNRADPLETTVDNWVYMIKDGATDSGSPSGSTFSHTSFYDVTDNCIQDGSCSSTPNLTSGWRLELELDGEKSLATPTTLAKKIFITTYIPPGSGVGGSCEPDEGTGRLYALSLENASAVINYAVSNGDTLAKIDRYDDLDSGGIPAEVVYIPSNKILKPDLTIEEVDFSGRWNTYWYQAEN